MANILLEPELMAEAPDVTHIITEDDMPVDNLPSEKQQHCWSGRCMTPGNRAGPSWRPPMWASSAP